MGNRRRAILFILMWGCFHVYLSGAANIWIERFATSSAIDLASADFWKPANVWGSDANSSNKKYSDRQILAVVGVIDSPEIASVSFLSDWWLTSASDPTLKRPFAVCLVPRVNHENFPDKTSYSYPLYGYLGLSSVLSFTLPKTNGGTVRTDGTNIVPSGGTNVYPSVGSAWIDVVLVFEDVLNPDGTLSGEPECLVAPGDDYVGSLTISVQTGSVAQSLTFFINGYYGSEYANSISTCQLVVTPYVTNTNAFDIRTSKNNNLFMKIADIDFSVNSVRSSVPPQRLLFVRVQFAALQCERFKIRIQTPWIDRYFEPIQFLRIRDSRPSLPWYGAHRRIRWYDGILRCDVLGRQGELDESGSLRIDGGQRLEHQVLQYELPRLSFASGYRSR